MIQIWRNREELEHQVVALCGQGLSRRAISLTCGVSRNTVKRILRAHEKRRREGQEALSQGPARAPRPSKLDPFVPRIQALLAKYPDVTAQRVYEILREEGFDGGTTAVKKAMRRLRPKPKPEPSRATPVYEPGQMAECDWSPYEVPFADGSQQTLQAFGYTLVHSRRKFFAVFLSNDLYALMDGHLQAFGRFKGLAKECKYDSQKPVVLRWEGHQPIFNPRFLAFSTYYEYRPHALRGNPNGKPRVERSFLEMLRSFFNARSFLHLEDLRVQIVRWLETIVDQRRRFRTTALERFALEQPQLRALPSHPYDTARVVHRVCSIDGFVDWQGNRYAVPYEHVTDILPLRITQDELFVYAADLSCIARHELAPRGLGLKLDPEGFHPPAGHRPAADADQLRLAFERMGDGAMQFFRLLSQGPSRLYCHQARLILALRSRFETKDLVAALEHAARYGALRAESVEQILLVRSRPRTFEEYVCEHSAQRLAQTIGLDRTEPRDLSEYDAWPVSGRRPAQNNPEPQDKDPAPCEKLEPTPKPLPRSEQPQSPEPTPTRCSCVCALTFDSSD